MIVALLLFCFWFCAAVTIVVIGALPRPLGRSSLLLAPRQRDPLTIVPFYSPAPRRGSWILAAVRRLYWLGTAASAVGLDSAPAAFRFCRSDLDRRLRRKREDNFL
ncbi:hypothetical protein M9H77_30722 [Catharanthus roseus]|uniref:Uncharacterized protein n=1 Tax=Catharanthus roseus TaxID=4058 RepID=A0ACB9ZZ39_CATRO|nr:hypothetical protein M9H77_30722 [Catharanthus roseus]